MRDSNNTRLSPKKLAKNTKTLLEILQQNRDETINASKAQPKKLIHDPIFCSCMAKKKPQINFVDGAFES